MENIAITGGASFLCGLLIKRLADNPSIKQIHVFDIFPPTVSVPKMIFHRLDLTREDADQELTTILLENNIETFVHGALFSSPTADKRLHHEVESIGTYLVLNAIAAAKIKKIVVLGDTFVYGARANNPNFFAEDAPLRPSHLHFIKTRMDAEKQILDFAKIEKSVVVTTLRFAPVLGPNATDVRARYFLAPFVPKMMGFDPLVQFIHEEDAVRAALIALEKDVPGVFNIVGSGVMTLSTGFHLAHKLAVPVPSFLGASIFEIGCKLKLWDVSPELVTFCKYVCVADGRKAEKKMGFKAKFSSRQALRAMFEAHRLRKVGFSPPSFGFGEDYSNASIGFERIL